MEFIPQSLNSLATRLSKLPGIGPKSALRLAYHIVGKGKEEGELLALSIKDACEKMTDCKICHNISDEDECFVCQNPNRNKGVICVVTHPKDIIAVEKTREYSGVYHVLGGSLSPTKGIAPDDLNIDSLIERAKEAKEVILATDTDVEGEATAIYISNKLSELGVKVSRIAHGVPVGGNLEFADQVTIIKALENRTVF